MSKITFAVPAIATYTKLHDICDYMLTTPDIGYEEYLPLI